MTPNTKHEALRQQIAADIAAFEARGKEIRTYDIVRRTNKSPRANMFQHGRCRPKGPTGELSNGQAAAMIGCHPSSLKHSHVKGDLDGNPPPERHNAKANTYKLEVIEAYVKKYPRAPF